MSAIEALQRLCGDRRSDVPREVRRRELGELAAVVVAALLIELMLPRESRGEGWRWVRGGLHVFMPFAAAWTLRRSNGGAALSAAAVMAAGLAAAAFVVPATWSRELTSNAYVAVAMVWVLAADRRTSAAAAAAGAVVLAIAWMVAALI
jgi:hypothetical protein